MGYGRSLGIGRSLGTRIRQTEQQAQSLREAQELSEYMAWVQTLTDDELREEWRQLDQRRSEAKQASDILARDGRSL